MGDHKLREFGSRFLEAIREFLGSNPRQMFADEGFSAVPVFGRPGGSGGCAAGGEARRGP